MKLTHGDWAGWQFYIQTRDGRRLPEHRVTHHRAKGGNPPTTNVFLEYRDGQQVEIYAMNHTTRYYDTRLSYWVDGRRLESCAATGTRTHAIVMNESCENRNGQLWMRNLRFDPLKRVEHGYMVDKAFEQQLGTVAIELKRGVSTSQTWRDYPWESPAPRSILNASIKPDRLSSYIGGGYLEPAVQTEVGEFRTSAYPRTYKVIFHYFTREVLMAMDIIPNPNNTPLLRAVSEEFESRKPWYLKDIYDKLKREQCANSGNADAGPSDMKPDDDDAASDAASTFSEFSFLSLNEGKSNASDHDKGKGNEGRGA